MSEHETIADIIAEMRALSNPISDGIIAIDGRSIADRLEAAHKRERGNCAKFREACANIVDYVQSAMCHATDAHVLDYLTQVEMWAKAALASPPRNCEKYTTVDEAMHDFADEALIEEWNALKAGKDRDMLAEELFLFAKWLFAPATEKEGGDDGNK